MCIIIFCKNNTTPRLDGHMIMVVHFPVRVRGRCSSSTLLKKAALPLLMYQILAPLLTTLTLRE